jgi:hypothetical protein
MAIRSGVSSLALLSLALAVACGSRTGPLTDEPAGGNSGSSGGGSDSGGGVPSGSSSGSGGGSSSGPAPDASAPCEAPAPTSGDAYFTRLDDFLGYFRLLAVGDQPALCGGGSTLETCAYDPRAPRADSSDIHHSDPLNEFIAPDGDPFIWVYLPDKNVWIVADARRSPGEYDGILGYVTCVASPSK